MSHEYLPDATDFTDMERKQPRPDQRRTVECPKCHGFGGWNLRLNAYGKPGDAAKFRHFQAMCGQCWGWGFVEPGRNAECVHEFKEIAPDQHFNCWHTIKCTKCDETRSYSSDD